MTDTMIDSILIDLLIYAPLSLLLGMGIPVGIYVGLKLASRRNQR